MNHEYPIGLIISRIAIAWHHSIVLELSEELKALPLYKRPLAIEYIYERCLKYSSIRVKKVLNDIKVQNEIKENPEKNAVFILLVKSMKSGKYLDRIIRQIRLLLPKWQENSYFDLKEFYNELYPRKESIGEHDGCAGEVIVSGSNYRCRKCKIVGQKIRENTVGKINFLDLDTLQ